MLLIYVICYILCCKERGVTGNTSDLCDEKGYEVHEVAHSTRGNCCEEFIGQSC